jgi:hypothetical protein
MPATSRGSDRTAARPRPLAEVYRRFAEVDAAPTSPLYAAIALALSDSTEALQAIESAPAGKRNPRLILAALHDLALAGRASSLAAAYGAVAQDPGDAAWQEAAAAAVDTLLSMTEAVVELALRRRVRTDEIGHGAVLYPVIAEAAQRVGAQRVGLVDVGCSAGFNLSVDRIGITYRNGRNTAGRRPVVEDVRAMGDLASAVQQSASVVGPGLVPTRHLPEVVARMGIDREPLDVTDPDDVRWLRACLAPDEVDEAVRLDAELAVAAMSPPVLLRGDGIELLPEALTHMPADALAVVITTWTLSAYALAKRRRFLHALEEAAARRPVAWVSAEGVGVAPTIPTLGDRPASGHSMLGLALFDGSSRRVEAVGRCWSRGRLLSWLAEP